ncbi:MAG: hypothetical protein HY746_07460 [Elusimicrobia bacterium]|nr:hypothetical protein [Elusimicrobiota bacterium]
MLPAIFMLPAFGAAEDGSPEKVEKKDTGKQETVLINAGNEGEIRIGDMELYVGVSGIASAQDLYDIPAPFDGRIEEVMAEQFDHVKKESVLLKMVSHEMAAMLDTTGDESKEELERRWKGVFNYHLVYPQGAGIVASIYIKPRQTVYKGERLFTIARKVIIIGNTTELLYSKPQLEAPAALEYARDSSVKVNALLKNLIPLKDKEGFYKVWLEVTDLKNKIRVGGIFKGHLFVGRTEEARIVPRSALIEANGKKYMVLEVETGLSTREEIELLKPGNHFLMPK